MPMRRHLWAAAGLVLLHLTASPAPAEDAPSAAAAKLDAAKQADLARIEAYLQDLSTLRARFIQTTSQGDYAEGEMLLDRPGKVRFEYDPPNPVLIVAKSGSLLYYNRELRQASFLPLSATPLRFITEPTIKLADNARLLDVSRSASTLRVTLANASDEDDGTLTLIFTEEPLALRQWEVVDAEGTIIQVALRRPQFGVPIAASAFDTGDLDLYGLEDRQKGR